MANSGPIRTYKEVIQFFENLCNSHLAIQQFQSGTISDIDVQTKDLPITKYPLVFLVHRGGSIERDGGSSITTFDFTLMVMDISKDRENLEVARLSDTHDILMDLISKIALTTWDEVQLSIDFPVLTTPFVERFNNRLTGWGAEISVDLKAPLNLCYAAFE